jgi:hypothetical protein
MLIVSLGIDIGFYAPECMSAKLLGASSLRDFRESDSQKSTTVIGDTFSRSTRRGSAATCMASRTG